ncbi:putative permease [Desulfitobacterium dehalogenans ATCC 51507]|uniref:Probable membrane transporter protein n=1 Tax=Desulfitobacterium dehalogenans (strain ATCC 51507 / DSM 9161 / JW/IU-DC1) TaxID=756499 RepID=I4A8P2_DESDJ|nr:sulfite exporter TauE/SafE family protein [Desulfitobacterium dehalogenans]AFM00327.1 putative permease [Desulfitobacterium dehalogenans ATCC 51507]
MKASLVYSIFSVLSFILFYSYEPSHVMSLLFIIGFLASIVGTLYGGGGLITLPAMMLLGIPVQMSVATNKFSSGLAAFVNVMTLLYQRKITLQNIWWLLCTAFCGGVFGAFVTVKLSTEVMNVVACIFLLFTLVITVKRKKLVASKMQNSTSKRQLTILPLLIGMYDGGFGPGSSTMSILYFLKRGFSYLKAAEYTRVLIFSSCSGAFIWFYLTGFINWGYVWPITIGSIIGSQLGLNLLPYISAKYLERLLPIILVLLIFQVLWNN